MRLLHAFCVVALLAAGPICAKAQIASGNNSPMTPAWASHFHRPLAFAANQGQFAHDVRFRADAGAATFYFCPSGAAYVYTRSRHRMEALLILVRFVGADPEVEPLGMSRLPHHSNYFRGSDSTRWRTNVPNYGSVTYRDIYPGIDLTYHGDGRSMKYDFIVRPGADLSQIRIRYEGADGLSLSDTGELEILTSCGTLREMAPVIYQEIDGRKHYIAGRYEIKGPADFGFSLSDNYNTSQPLVIDPELTYSTYLGGLDWDESDAIALGVDGSIYIAGETWCPDFPVVNPFQGTIDSVSFHDAFIARFAPDGSSLIYSTYLGGTQGETVYGLAVDADGNAYITGKTGSSDFPTFNAYDDTYNGCDDAFVASLSNSGDALLYSTYLGGSNREQGRDIARASGGSVYVTGYTNSTDFPTVNAFDGTHNGRNDVFVARFSTAGDSLLYSTYLGGTEPDYSYSLVIDDDGHAYIAGGTGSPNFPTANPYCGSSNGVYDAFVAKLSRSGDSLLYATYLGGSDDDVGWGIGRDSEGCIHIAGGTRSWDFPAVNAIDPSFNGDMDAFVTRLSPLGDSLTYSTFLGGGMYDEVWGMVLDANGCAHITGGTSSWDFPTVNAYDETHNGSYDVFVAQLANLGDSLVYSTFLGGSDPDYGFDIALGVDGDAYVTGRTRSCNFPTVDPYDGDYNGYYDAFIARFSASASQAADDPTIRIGSSGFSSDWRLLFGGDVGIRYTLTAPGKVRLVVCSVSGRVVETLIHEPQCEGNHGVRWNAERMDSGVYFLRLGVGGRVVGRCKIVLAR